MSHLSGVETEGGDERNAGDRSELGGGIPLLNINAWIQKGDKLLHIRTHTHTHSCTRPQNEQTGVLQLEFTF